MLTSAIHSRREKFLLEIFPAGCELHLSALAKLGGEKYNLCRMQIAKSLSEHYYPPVFLHFPALIRLVHGWNSLFFPRNWLTYKALRHLLKGLPPGSFVLDAGCGEGQHLFSFARKFPRLQFLGVDKNEAHIAFCRAYTGKSRLGNLEFLQQNLEAISFKNQVDVLLCIGTLQYVEKDAEALRIFYKALKVNGSLLLYAPVNGRSVLPFYGYFFDRLDHYDKRQKRRRIYSPEEILEKLAAAGLTIQQQKSTHGWLGILSHEIYSLLLMGVGNLGWTGTIFFGSILVGLLPFLLVFKVWDGVFPKKQGNGFFLVAKKGPVTTHAGGFDVAWKK